MKSRFFEDRLFYTLHFFLRPNTTLSNRRERGRNHQFLQFSTIWPSLSVSTSAEKWPLTQTTVSARVARHFRPHWHHSKAKKHNLQLQTAKDSPGSTDPRGVLAL